MSGAAPNDLSGTDARPFGYVMLIPTHRCNLACPFCFFTAKRSDATGELSAGEILEIFHRSAILRGLPISISGGEPLLRHDLPELAQGLLGMGNQLHITTNGFSPEAIRKLVRCCSRLQDLTVAISIDGVGPLHDKIRGKDGIFEKAARSMDIISSSGAKLQINTVVLKDNLDHLGEIKQSLSRFEGRHIFIPIMPETMDPSVFPYSDDDVAKMLPFMPTSASVKHLLSRGAFRIKDCCAGLGSVHIEPDGSVFPCEISAMSFRGETRASFLMGNLRAVGGDFDSLWLSQKAQKARRAVASCRGCFTFCNARRQELCGRLDTSFHPGEFAGRLSFPAAIDLAADGLTYCLPNWHEAESDRRWSKKKSSIFMRRNPGKGKLRIRAVAENPDIEIKPVVVTVKANRAKATELCFHRKAWLDFELALNVPYSAPFFELSLEADRTWCPSEYGASADRRELGIGVQRVELS